MKKDTSTNSINNEALQNFCKVYKVLAEITGRWKVPIIFSVSNEEKLYSEIKTKLPNVTDRILVKQLKELQENNIIINKKDKSQSTYLLDTKGKQILKLIEHINQLQID